MGKDDKLIQQVFGSAKDQKVVIKPTARKTSSSSAAASAQTWKQYASSLADTPAASVVSTKQSKKQAQASQQASAGNCKPVLTRWDSGNLSLRNPLSSELDYMLCSYCQRPVLSSALQYHVESACPLSTQVAASSSASVTASAPPAATTTGTTNSSSNKKRKFEETEAAMVDDENNDSEKSLSAATTPVKKTKKQYTKKKKASKVTAAAAAVTASSAVSTELETSSTGTSPVAKSGSTVAAAAAAAASRKKKEKKDGKEKPSAKGNGASAAGQKVVDVEKRCGVPLPNGQLCARSLTCKTHSMGAKRAVQGRSAPYDVLLSQYQKRNQVKQASNATAQQLADENEALGGNTGPINEDEEVAQVMEGVKRANMVAAPLERRVLLSTRVKNQYFRIREMFAQALQPKGTPASGGIGGLFGRANAFGPDQPEQLAFVRPPSLQRLNYLQAMRQQQYQQQRMLQQQQQQPPGGQSRQNSGSPPAPNPNPNPQAQAQPQQPQQQQFRR